MPEPQNFTPITELIDKQPKKSFLKPSVLIIMLLVITLPILGFFIYQRQNSSSKADETAQINEPDVIRWCRDNSWKGSIEAPGTVTADSDGNYSFTAHSSFDPDEVCASIAERLDEQVVPGLPGGTRGTTCVDPILSNGNCSVSVSWDGRYGASPQEFTVSGKIDQGSTCRLYLLTIRGVPTCARANVTVIKSITIPTPTPVLECPLPKLDVELVCPLCNSIQ